MVCGLFYSTVQYRITVRFPLFHLRAVGCVFGELLNNSPLFPVRDHYNFANLNLLSV